MVADAAALYGTAFDSQIYFIVFLSIKSPKLFYHISDMKSTKREGKRADNAVSLYFYPIRRKITTPLEIQGESRAFIDILNISELFRLE